MKGLSAQNSVALCCQYDSREEMQRLNPNLDMDAIDDDDKRTWPERKIERTVTIEFYANGGFNVREGDRYSDLLSFDEMLGTVASLAMPPNRPCLRWLQTKEEHAAWREGIKAKNNTEQSTSNE